MTQKGTEYLSVRQRKALSDIMRALRKERDTTAKAAIAIEKRKIWDWLLKVCRSDSGSRRLRQESREFRDRAKRALSHAQHENTNGRHFNIRDEDQLRNILRNRALFSEEDDVRIWEMYRQARANFQVIDTVRREHPLIEPGGIIRDGCIEWSDRDAWQESVHAIALSQQERFELAAKGAIFFHCHPTREEFLDSYATRASSGDYLAITLHRRELIFCQAGVVLLASRRPMSFEATKKVIQETKRAAEQNFDDAEWAFAEGLIEQFRTVEFILQPSLFEKAEGTI